MKLKDACNILNGRTPKLVEGGNIPVINIGSKLGGYTDKPIAPPPLIAIGAQGTVGKPRYFDTPVWVSSTQIYITAKEGIYLKYIFSILDSLDWTQYRSTFTVMDGLSMEHFENIEIPTPL